jgi:hypothetical protein
MLGAFIDRHPGWLSGSGGKDRFQAQRCIAMGYFLSVTGVQFRSGQIFMPKNQILSLLIFTQETFFMLKVSKVFKVFSPLLPKWKTFIKF